MAEENQKTTSDFDALDPRIKGCSPLIIPKRMSKRKKASRFAKRFFLVSPILNDTDGKVVISLMNYLLTLAYDGTNYCGFQVQPNGRSVAAVFQDALEEVLGCRPDIKGCSRTDAGVHALGFMLNFHADTRIPAAKAGRSLSSSASQSSGTAQKQWSIAPRPAARLSVKAEASAAFSA